MCIFLYRHVTNNNRSLRIDTKNIKEKQKSHIRRSYICHHHYNFSSSEINTVKIRCLVVHSLLRNLRHGVRSSTISRVIHCEVSIAQARSEEDPVATIVDICNNSMTLSQSIANLALIRLLNTLERSLAEGIDSAPINIASTGISTVVGQPSIQGGRILVSTFSLKDHGDRTHCTSS